MTKKGRIRCMLCREFYTLDYQTEGQLYLWVCPKSKQNHALPKEQKYRIIYIQVERY